MLAVPSIMGRKPSGRLSLPITIPAYAAATIYCKPKKADIGKVEWTERVRLWQVDNNSCSVRWDSCRIIPEYYFSLINCCNCCNCCKLFSEGLFQPLTPTSCLSEASPLKLQCLRSTEANGFTKQHIYCFVSAAQIF